MRTSLLLLVFIGVLCCFSCSHDTSNPHGNIEEATEFSLTYLGQKSLFGVIVNEYRVAIDLRETVVDSVEVVVIDNGDEFIYGSLSLENNKGRFENLKVPAFISVLHIDFFDDKGVQIRERAVIQLP